MISAQERKEKNLQKLKEEKVPYFAELPLIETAEEVKPRSGEEIAKRAITCLLTIQLACDYLNDGVDISESRKIISGILNRYSVEGELTDKEKVFYEGEPDKQECLNMSWKYEAYWTLLWGLGIVEKLDYPSGICDCDFAIQAVSKHRNLASFMQSVKLRDIEEILDEADLIYRYNWACVDARINNREIPAGLNPGVVFERHWGLNWLIGKDTYNDNWDTVSTDT